MRFRRNLPPLPYTARETKRLIRLRIGKLGIIDGWGCDGIGSNNLQYPFLFPAAGVDNHPSPVEVVGVEFKDPVLGAKIQIRAGACGLGGEGMHWTV